MDFYYMGDVSPELNNVEQSSIKNDKGKQIPVVRIKFNLANPVTVSMYNYLQEKRETKDSAVKKQTKTIHTKNIIEFEETFKNPIPLYNFYAAAGTFSEMQTEKDFTLIEGPENTNLNNDYFACKIVGQSMNKIIPDGSICLFKIYTGGSRNGKIVLVENRDIQDPDFNSAFTIKTYTSEKVVTEDNWVHKSIVLRPNSYDNSYKNIIITEENAEGMRVVAEFIKVL